MANSSSVRPAVPGPWSLIQIQQFAVIAGILLLSALLAPKLPPWILTLLPVAGAFFFLIREPEIGLLFLVLFSVGLPLSWTVPGTDTSFPISVIFLGVQLMLWAATMLRDRRIHIVQASPIPPLIGLVIVATIALFSGLTPSLLYAQNAPLIAQAAGLATFYVSVGAFLLVANQITQQAWLERLTWLFLLAGSLVVLGRQFSWFQRLYFLIGSDKLGSMFWTWITAISVGQALYNRSLHPLARLLLAGLCGTSVFVTFVGSRSWTSGWLPSFLAVVTVLLVGIPWQRARLWLLIAGILTAIISTPSVFRLLMVEEAYSFLTRVEAARILSDIAQISPLIGLGPANYRFYTPLFSILGWNVEFNSHNQYLDIMVQTGLLGLGCYLWFFVAITRLTWRLLPRVPDGFARAYLHGALGGIAGMLMAGMLGDWIIPFVYNVGIAGMRSSIMAWLFLGGVVVLKQLYDPPARSAEAEGE